jgi:predicted porin
MKKSSGVLAVLSLVAAAAHAQSSVTVYGRVDLGLVLDSGNPAGKSVRLSNGVTGGSRLGFKGMEDLGGGTKAAFQLETGLCPDSAASTGSPGTVSASGTVVGSNFCTGGGFMGRQAHLDLMGAFGIVSAGRQYSLGFNNLASIDPFGAAWAGNSINTDGAGNYLVDASGVRLNNSVTYTTPAFSNVTASVEVALGETTGNARASRETGAAVIYAKGPAYAGVSYYEVANPNGQGTARRNALAGGTYDFGVAKIHALVQKVTGDPTGAPSQDILNLLGGATVPVAGGFLMASYIHHDDHTSLNRDANQWSGAYQYLLSKRTSLYVAYARIKNDNGANFHVGNATEVGTGNKGFDLGVAHNF